MWISEDGITWSMLPEDAPPGFDRGGMIESVTAGGPASSRSVPIYPRRCILPVHQKRQLAQCPGIPRRVGLDGAVWASGDGLAWRSVELAEPGGGLGWFNDTTVGGPVLSRAARGIPGTLQENLLEARTT